MKEIAYHKKLMIFDLDGTLYDTGEVNYFAYQKALNKVGYSVEKEYYIEHCNGYHYKRFLPDILYDLQGDELTGTMEKVHQYKKDYYKEFLYAVRENAFLFDMIAGMKQMYHMALVTTASRKNTEEILEFTKKSSYFEYLLCQEDVVMKKPDPEGFQKAMEHFGVSPEDTVIFEDSDVGIEAANASGARVMKIYSF